MKLYPLLLLLLTIFSVHTQSCQAQQKEYVLQKKIEAPILTGAAQLDTLLPMLTGKRVALIGNQTSEVNGIMLPDILLERGVQLVKLFSPEHGFRGSADAGAKVSSGKDPITGLPIFSLYGNNKKIPHAELKGIDVLLYDLQDVGVRFYTYISTLEYAMQACSETGTTLIVLDRPNPLGNIVDGPVLKSKFKSFVGMQPIPIIYGMTPAEYALMLLGEAWTQAPKLNLKVIPLKYYNHQSTYHLPVAPSPNLKNMAAVYLYPSLCLFEGTDVSLGRGTTQPFQQYGHPAFKNMPHSFTPRSMPGASNPPQLGKLCYGEFLADDPEHAKQLTDGKFQIKWIINAYQKHPNKKSFFKPFFHTLAGTDQLAKQIAAGLSEDEIRKSWEADLNHFRSIRKKYLLYAE